MVDLGVIEGDQREGVSYSTVRTGSGILLCHDMVLVLEDEAIDVKSRALWPHLHSRPLILRFTKTLENGSKVLCRRCAPYRS
jgi:hypothetical protein